MSSDPNKIAHFTDRPSSLPFDVRRPLEQCCCITVPASWAKPRASATLWSVPLMLRPLQVALNETVMAKRARMTDRHLEPWGGQQYK